MHCQQLAFQKKKKRPERGEKNLKAGDNSLVVECLSNVLGVLKKIIFSGKNKRIQYDSQGWLLNSHISGLDEWWKCLLRDINIKEMVIHFAFIPFPRAYLV